MKETSIWSYISVGTCLRYLQDQQVGWHANAPDMTVANINSFLSSLDKLGLHVTKRSAWELEKLRDGLAAKGGDYALTDEDVTNLGRVATDVRKTFEAETMGVYTYVVTDKRLEVRKLLSDVSALFAPGVYDACSAFAQYDFTEAGRCIAFERATSAAFHLLRGTESVVRLYYKRFIRPAQTGLTWGQMTHVLSTKTTGKRPAPAILTNLDHIRTNFRNPTQHPDKIYDIQEAQDLFSLCVDAVNRMMPDILK